MQMHKLIVNNLLKSRFHDDTFPELALTLYAFTERLYEAVKEKQVADLCFLSREGQLLMRLFERYQDHDATPHAYRVRCHYLEVSRRSTFLPSLGSLKLETFDTLFRQYRNISVCEFLASLGLDAYSGVLAAELGVTENAMAIRLGNLPSQPIFKRLLANDTFCKIYESERFERRKVFIAYLKTLFGGRLPDALQVVDVGWKGTIQDNLFNLLCRDDTGVDSIEGYYVGLIAPGGANSRNKKHGVLFSSVERRSPGFATFNENRALFEITLAADHGSVNSYRFDEHSNAGPVRDRFEEADLVADFVVPVQKRIVERFSELLKCLRKASYDRDSLLKTAALYHGRMVFRPTEHEVQWFSTVYHVENFGVFEHSRFGGAEGAEGFFRRLRFTLKLIYRPRRVPLGFWPWLAIRRHSFAPFARAYRLIRTGSLK